MLVFTNEQIDKLSDFFLALAKGQILGALAIPILTGVDIFVLLKLFISGMICLYFSFTLLEVKK